MSEKEQSDFEGTEPQRRALEEMSQQLLERLNEMVEMQERRAREFAASGHSLSSLPEGVALPEVTPLSAELPEVPEAPPTRSVEPPPLVRRNPMEREAAAAASAAPKPRPVAVPQPQAQGGEQKIGVMPIMIVIALIYILLRGCSS